MYLQLVLHCFAGKVTGSSLAEFLGLFEPLAGKALTKAGVYAKMRDHAKLLSKVLSLQHPRQGLVVVEPQTQIFFDWGHKHEANGILSYLTANPSSVVHEVGFVLLDPTLQSLPEGVRQGINPNDLPVIGSSPDGIIVETAPTPPTLPLPLQSLPPGAPAGPGPPAQPPHQHAWFSPPQQYPQAQPPQQDPQAHPLHQHWRQSNPSHRRVLEIKAKTSFRPDSLPGVWRWLGASCKPYTRILPQYFAQAQLNMLVTNSGSCHLLCYTVKGGSKVFTIPLDTQWCNQMLHWVAQLNICYVRKGLEPPENVFWEQEAYRGFVDMTRAACQRMDDSGVEVPSKHGSMSSPWFLAASDAPVPDSLEIGPADQLPQQQLHWQLWTDGSFSQVPPQLQGQLPPQLQDQLPPQCPPGWQQQQQLAQVPAATERTQQQQQEQQQQHFSFNGSVAPSEAPAGGGQPASLRLLAAAAIPLPDEDVTVEAHPTAAPQGQFDPALGHPQQTPMELDSAGPVGAEGLATWMQYICDQHGVDLRPLLDSFGWVALSRLTADDRHTLEQLVKDVKEKTSALCMKHVSRFTAPETKATCRKKNKTDGPSHNGSSAANGLRAATHGPGAASLGPGAPSLGPGAAGASVWMNNHHQPDAMDTGADFEGAADPMTTRQPPVRLDAQGPGGIAARPALPGPGARAAATSPSTRAPASLPSPRPAFVSPGIVRANPSSTGTGAAGGPQATLAGPAPPAAAAADAGAQRALWPESSDCWISHVTTAAQQPGAAANSPGGPSSFRPALSRAGAAGPSAAVGLVLEGAALPELFGGKRLPADMAPNVQRRLHNVVAQHSMYLTPRNFDAAILDRLAKMPEDKAMKVLNQAASASWLKVQNNTRCIMAWCCRLGGHGQ